jgi:hypothetical protein
MTTQTTTKDSFYLERLKEYMSRSGGYWDDLGSTTNSYWSPRGRTRLKAFSQHKLVDRTYHELEYRGFQLIVVGWHYESRPVLDLAQKTTPDYIRDEEIGGYSNEVTTSSVFFGYAWEIGGSYDAVDKLNWITHGSVLNGIGCSDQIAKTIKIAQKKLDTLGDVKDARTEVISINNDRLDWNDAVNPFNVVVGDQVFIRAFGRFRKGVVVKTTGSKFVVGYATPSNPNELKYKTLALSQLWAEQ